MRAIFSVFFAGLLLAACGPTATFHRTGAPMALMENTLLDCKVEALGDAPVATQVRQGPPRYVPGPVYCPRKGQCTRGAGYFAPGEVYSVDTNARLRSDLINRCMARSGFQRVDLPRCAAGTPLPDLSAQSEGMPP
ncbi:MAG: hypothetical protein AAGF27_09050, partial [Pseudomonadota bacterium]